MPNAAVVRVGLLTLDFNGIDLLLAGEATVSLGRRAGDAERWPDGHTVITEKYSIPMLEVDIRDHPGLDLDTILGTEPGTLTGVMTNGKKFVLHEATEQNGGEGMNLLTGVIPAKWIGVSTDLLDA